MTSISATHQRTSGLRASVQARSAGPLLPVHTAMVHTELADSDREGRLRWVVLLFNCILLIGNYYAYDNPAALSTLMELYLGWPRATFDYAFGLLYSLYSLPNILLPLVSGFVIDRYGPKYALLGLSACVCLGQALFALGVTVRNLPMMLVGRILFGVGGESVSVAQSCITTRWFLKKELALALALNLAIPRVGSVLNASFSPMIAIAWNQRHPVSSPPLAVDQSPVSYAYGVPVALLVGLLMCCISFMSAAMLVFVIGTEPSAFKSIAAQSPSSMTTVGTGLDSQPPSDVYTVDDDDGKGVHGTEERPLLTPVKSSMSASHTALELLRRLPVSFWILCAIVMLMYGTIIPFNNVISEFLQTKWFPSDIETSGKIMGVPDSICAILISFCGYAIDRFGKRASSLVLCSLMVASVHITLAMVPAGASVWAAPILPLIVLGLAYSLYGAAFWSSIACLFSLDGKGTADQEEQIAEVLVPSSPPASAARLFHSGLSPLPRRVRSVQTQSRLTGPLTDPAADESMTGSLLFARRICSVDELPFVHLSTTTLPLLAASRVLRNLSMDSATHFMPTVDASLSFTSAVPSPVSLTMLDGPSTDTVTATTSGPLSAAMSKNEDMAELAQSLATAYGIATSAMNLSLTVVPLLTAAIKDHFSSTQDPVREFVAVELFFAAEALMAALLSVVVWQIDVVRFGGRQLQCAHMPNPE